MYWFWWKILYYFSLKFFLSLDFQSLTLCGNLHICTVVLESVQIPIIGLGIAGHSTWELLVQVMKSSSKNPLTPGRWVHKWLKFAKIEMFRRGYLTNKFSKCEKWPIWLSNFEFHDIYPYILYDFSKVWVTQ